MDGAYKEHRENVLVEREMALLPATQPAVANFLLAENLKKSISESGAWINEMKEALHDAKRARLVRGCLSRRNAKHRIVIESVEHVRSMIFDCVTLRAKMFNNLAFEFQPCMVATDMNLHGGTFSKKKENRWYFYQRFLF